MTPNAVREIVARSELTLALMVHAYRAMAEQFEAARPGERRGMHAAIGAYLQSGLDSLEASPNLSPLRLEDVAAARARIRRIMADVEAS